MCAVPSKVIFCSSLMLIIIIINNYYYYYQNRISAELELPSLPEMLFGENILKIDHAAGFGIQFDALDALKLVDNKHDLMKVAVAEEWQNKR